MPRFENQRVLVTGSGRGIGSAIAHRFAQEGARIQLVARSMDELEQTPSELAPLASEVRAMTLDLVLPGSARQLVDEVARGWGGLDILVTNAGAAAQGGFLELEDDAWAAGFGLKMFANLRYEARLAAAEGLCRPSRNDRRRHCPDSRASAFARLRCERWSRLSVEVHCRTRNYRRHSR